MSAFDSNSINDKEKSKFVESPSRPGETAVEVVVSGDSITIDNATISVDLDHTEDSVRLGDGTNLTTVNASGELQVRDDDANTALTSIDGKLVDGNDIGDVTINNAAGASAVNIQDGGNSITVDGVDLDIRDISHTVDSIQIGDGVDLAGVTASNELLVNNPASDVILGNILTQLESEPTNETHLESTFTGVGNITTDLNIRSKEFLSIEVTGVNPGNLIDVKARITGGTYKKIWTIKGTIESKSVNISGFDQVEVEVVTFDSSGTGSITVSAFDSNHKEDFENLEVTLVEAGITYTAATKEPTADQSDPVWRIKREFTSNGSAIVQFANDGGFTEILANKENVFPNAQVINNLSVLLDGVDESISLPFNASTDFDANSQTFSISCWHKRTSPSATSETIFSNLAFAQSPQIPGIVLFASNEVTSLLVINDNSTSNSINHTFPGITDSNWHHYMLTFDGTGTSAGINYYIDGVLIVPSFTTDNLSASTANGNVATFGIIDPAFNFFPSNGNFDEMSLWSIELSQSDIDVIYNEGKPSDLLIHPQVLLDSSVLLSYYRIDGDTHPTLSNLGSLGAATDATMLNSEATDFVEDVP